MTAAAAACGCCCCVSLLNLFCVPMGAGGECTLLSWKGWGVKEGFLATSLVLNTPMERLPPILLATSLLAEETGSPGGPPAPADLVSPLLFLFCGVSDPGGGPPADIIPKSEPPPATAAKLEVALDDEDEADDDLTPVTPKAGIPTGPGEVPLCPLAFGAAALGGSGVA